MRFAKHYTQAEANALLPQIRRWLGKLDRLRNELQAAEKRLQEHASAGSDLGGPSVNAWVRLLAETQEVLMEFFRREIQIKDLERGLLDFPAMLHGKEVFLCWEQGEELVEFWHDLDSGYAGRQRL
jgi:hypothetical protein